VKRVVYTLTDFKQNLILFKQSIDRY